MVVGLALAAVQMGMALPTGFLFGVGYGTGVRIGYEQVYPLLFPKGARSTTSELAATMKGMNTVYDAIGGKDASRMGIAVGITNAGEILNNPDFRVLEKLESSSSGLTSSNSTPLDSDGNPLLPPLVPSFSIIPQKGDIFFTQPTTTLSNKEFLIKEINTITSVQELVRRRNSYTDPNLIQIIEARIRQLRAPSQQTKIVNTVPTAPPVKTVTPNKEQAEYIGWQKNLSYWQARFEQFKIKAQLGDRNAITIVKEARASIVRYSNEYRHPNNTIRNHALRLRKELSSGIYDYNKR